MRLFGARIRNQTRIKGGMDQIHKRRRSVRATYNFNYCLAALLDGEGKRSLQATVFLLDHDESLVRPLALAVLLGGQDELDRVRRVERERLREGGLLAEPVQFKGAKAPWG